ncbi:PREDICTED: uncharacterized protein LOC104807743 [Tarenaya hassleriana]|uniref:uncharacterized protein LOC104807743 n=1 Tax=Tarenaya hassleriana TaxID=28532 RepID=UPI00053C6BF5|nr:PREDICTED: uncharacterized protein LOC104807743 [Tarenaya hassleriana]
MDTFKPQKVKARKMKVITKKSTVQILSSLFFRAIEIIVVVVTVAKLVYQFVITFEDSGERFKGLAAILISRHVVFIVGNAIVIALLAKSGMFLNQESKARTSSDGFFEEFVRDSRRDEPNTRAEEKNRGNQSIIEIKEQSTTENRQRQSIAETECVTEIKGKQITTETRQRPKTSENRQKQSVIESESAMKIKGKHSTNEDTQRKKKIENRLRQKTGENMAKQSKSYLRSRSENMENPRISCGTLRRSETERCLKSLDTGDETRDLNDRMSNDELRYKIESFIARQRRNQKDEEFCVT